MSIASGISVVLACILYHQLQTLISGDERIAELLIHTLRGTFFPLSDQPSWFGPLSVWDMHGIAGLIEISYLHNQASMPRPNM